MSDEEVKLPEELQFKPSNPDSTACSLGMHTPVYSAKMWIREGKLYQLARCQKCGKVGAEDRSGD